MVSTSGQQGPQQCEASQVQHLLAVIVAGGQVGQGAAQLALEVQVVGESCVETRQLWGVPCTRLQHPLSPEETQIFQAAFQCENTALLGALSPLSGVLA